MKVEVEVCTIEKSVLITMVKRVVIECLKESRNEENYLLEKIGDQLDLLENLKMISYMNVNTTVVMYEDKGEN